jgi:hypothetical protein
MGPLSWLGRSSQDVAIATRDVRRGVASYRKGPNPGVRNPPALQGKAAKLGKSRICGPAIIVIARGRMSRFIAQEGLESAVARANPRVVASPDVRPNFPTASGIIESISITSSAPAANAWIAALKLSEATSAAA